MSLTEYAKGLLPGGKPSGRPQPAADGSSGPVEYAIAELNLEVGWPSWLEEATRARLIEIERMENELKLAETSLRLHRKAGFLQFSMYYDMVSQPCKAGQIMALKQQLKDARKEVAELKLQLAAAESRADMVAQVPFLLATLQRLMSTPGMRERAVKRAAKRTGLSTDAPVLPRPAASSGM